jgi:hypothetical protein
MECSFHPGEKTVKKCILCYTPICLKCMSLCAQLDYESLCPKCLRLIGLSWDCTCDDINYWEP